MLAESVKQLSMAESCQQIKMSSYDVERLMYGFGLVEYLVSNVQ